MIRVTELQTRILEALWRYRYVTASQFQQIGISHSLPVIWRILRQLSTRPVKRPLVGVIHFPARMRVESVERVHYLTEAGAMVLADILGCDLGELDFQKVTSVYHRDYWHRKYCVDFHIWLALALEAAPWDLEIAVFDRYFDKTGANHTKSAKAKKLRARTRVDLGVDQYLIPDANFVLQSVGDLEKQAVYSLEMANGRNTKRVLSQIEKHIVAMQNGVLAKQHGIRRPHSLLVLFEHLGTLQAVEQRITSAVPQRLESFVFLSHLNTAAKDVLRCWQQVGKGRLVNFVTGREVR